MKKAIRISLVVVIALAVIVGGYFGYQTLHRNQLVAEIENESPTDGVTLIDDLGATKTLEILPLVEKASAAPQYQSEHGVSYLVKTDSANILMDLGFNETDSNPSPLEHNMAQLGVQVEDIDTIVISHWHPDHVGGRIFWEQHTFSIGNKQVPLEDKRAFVPSPMTYPGLSLITASRPMKIAKGVASTGSLPFAEVMNSSALIPFLADATTGLPLRNTEQALVVNVSGRGIVIITGCGHPTVPKLVARAQAVFKEPVIGVIGGLHLAGAPAAVVQTDIDLLKRLNAQLVGLSPHDSDAGVIERFRAAFPASYQDVMVGRAFRLAGPGQ